MEHSEFLVASIARVGKLTIELSGGHAPPRACEGATVNVDGVPFVIRRAYKFIPVGGDWSKDVFRIECAPLTAVEAEQRADIGPTGTGQGGA